MIDDINIVRDAGDNTPFVSGKTPLHVMTSLENAAEKLFRWFTNNQMKANYDKCHLLMSMITPICIKAKNSAIRESDNGKLLGVAMDANLSFDLHLKIYLQVLTLARITPYMSIPKRKLLLNSFLLHNLIINRILGCVIALQ